MPAFGRTISYLRIYLLLIFCQSHKIPHDANLVKNDPVGRAKKVSVKYFNLPFFRPNSKSVLKLGDVALHHNGYSLGRCVVQYYNSIGQAHKMSPDGMVAITIQFF